MTLRRVAEELLILVSVAFAIATVICIAAISVGAESYADYTVTKYKDAESEDFLWEILHEECPNDYVAAGILGYFWRESFYRSDAVVNWHMEKAATGNDPCAAFTEQLDQADRKEFIRLVQASGGYGLGQWWAESHLRALYDFCKGYGRGGSVSFADAAMQCRFTIHMCTSDPKVWETLQNAQNALEAGKIIASLHDGTSTGIETIGAVAERIYKERCE